MKNKKNVNLSPVLTREEKIERLENSKIKLKGEFFGLDDIIDEIIKSVEPWYITPEVIKRPVIVSLWGMTGTGKSSVVKRLIELLGIDKSSMYFDCGVEANDTDSRSEKIPSKICDFLNIDENSKTVDLGSEVSFIFDEFQYAKTKQENGDELVRSNLRSIWKIIDDGILETDGNYDYDFTKLCDFLDDIKDFSSNYPGIKIKNLLIEKPEDVKNILNNIGVYVYDWRRIPDLESFGLGSNKDVEITPDEEEEPRGYQCSSNSEDKEEDKGKDPYRPLKVIPKIYLRAISKKLNRTKMGLGNEVMAEFLKQKTLGSLIDVLDRAIKTCNSKKCLDCRKSLVFIIGNLDEAYVVGKDIDPDMDADVLNDLTSHVTVSDIKLSLRRRFRSEQIARIGNNMIKYPTLRRVHFEKIIKSEVDRILQDFKEVNKKLKVTVKPEIYKLLYSEGVFPTQGARPIFTTIGSLLTPYLSKIVINTLPEDKEVSIGIKDIDDCNKREFKVEETTIQLDFNKGSRKVDYVYKLQLGSLRCPENRATRYINSVHEAGHAIMMAVTTGKLPSLIVSVSTNGGGFCSTYDDEMEGEISRRVDIDNEVMIGLAGYEAEKIIFDDRRDLCLMGSGSDLDNTWDVLSKAAMELGYFSSIPLASYDTQNYMRIPGGFRMDSLIDYDGEKMSLESAIRKRWGQLTDDTHKLLLVERKLIKRMALYLGEHGSMVKETFLDFIKRYGNNLNEEKLGHAQKEIGMDYYLSKLKDE